MFLVSLITLRWNVNSQRLYIKLALVMHGHWWPRVSVGIPTCNSFLIEARTRIRQRCDLAVAVFVSVWSSEWLAFAVSLFRGGNFGQTRSAANSETEHKARQWCRHPSMCWAHKTRYWYPFFMWSMYAATTEKYSPNHEKVHEKFRTHKRSAEITYAVAYRAINVLMWKWYGSRHYATPCI